MTFFVSLENDYIFMSVLSKINVNQKLNFLVKCLYILVNIFKLFSFEHFVCACIHTDQVVFCA